MRHRSQRDRLCREALTCWLLVGFIYVFISHGLHFPFTVHSLVEMTCWPVFVAYLAIRWIIAWLAVCVACALLLRIVTHTLLHKR